MIMQRGFQTHFKSISYLSDKITVHMSNEFSEGDCNIFYFGNVVVLKVPSKYKGINIRKGRYLHSLHSAAFPGETFCSNPVLFERVCKDNLVCNIP